MSNQGIVIELAGLNAAKVDQHKSLERAAALLAEFVKQGLTFEAVARSTQYADQIEVNFTGGF